MPWLENTAVPISVIDPVTGKPKLLRATNVSGDYADAAFTTTPQSGTLVALSPVTVTTTATALPAQAGSMVLVQADPDNTVDVLIGTASAQPMRLIPGASCSLPIANANQVYHRTASGTAAINVVVVESGSGAGVLVALAPITVTTTVTQLPQQPCRLVILQADPDNVVDIFVGTAAVQPIQLVPGASFVLPIVNADQVYHRTATGTAQLDVLIVA